MSTKPLQIGKLAEATMDKFRTRIGGAQPQPEFDMPHSRNIATRFARFELPANKELFAIVRFIQHLMRLTADRAEQLEINDLPRSLRQASEDFAVATYPFLDKSDALARQKS